LCTNAAAAPRRQLLLRNKHWPSFGGAEHEGGSERWLDRARSLTYCRKSGHRPELAHSRPRYPSGRAAHYPPRWQIAAHRTNRNREPPETAVAVVSGYEDQESSKLIEVLRSTPQY
jgi:hypothetical protein